MFMTTGSTINVGTRSGWVANPGLSNQNYVGNALSTIGNGSSNNVLTVLTNTTWNLGGFGSPSALARRPATC